MNEAPPIVHEVLRSSGQLLDPATRAFMEPRFGYDFSRVRTDTRLEKQIHTQGGGVERSNDGGAEETVPPSLAVTEGEIGTDLSSAKSWATAAARTMERYARMVRFLAAEPGLAYRISDTPLGRGSYCPIKDNFNLDPVTDEATYYGSQILAISARLNRIKATLDGLEPEHFQHVSITDRRCEAAGAFVISKTFPIYLCAGYWLDVIRRPATLIHEVAHIEGMYDEQYIRGGGLALPASSCIPHARFSIDASQTVTNPDSYAFLCADLRT